MGKLWLNGREVNKETYIAEAQLDIEARQAKIADYEKVIEFVNNAVESYFAVVYRPLHKALKEFDNLEELHNMYGYGAITKARYVKVCSMADEQERMKNAIAQFDLTGEIKRKIRDLNAEIEQIQLCLDYAIKSVDENEEEE